MLIAVPAGLTATPLWVEVVNRHAHAAAADRPRSWDLWADCASPAWDDLRHDSHDCCALSVGILEYLSGEELDIGHARRVAAGCRMWGKAYLYGLCLAVGATDEWDARSWCSYATAVARRANAERRAGRADGWKRSAAVVLDVAG